MESGETRLTQKTVPMDEEPKVDPGNPESGEAAVLPEKRPEELPEESAKERKTDSREEAVPASN